MHLVVLVGQVVEGVLDAVVILARALEVHEAELLRQLRRHLGRDHPAVREVSLVPEQDTRQRLFPEDKLPSVIWWST